MVDKTVDYGLAHPLHMHSLIGPILIMKVMDDATHNEDECRTTWYMFPWIPPNLYLRDSQSFAPQRLSQLLSSTESFTDK